MILAHSIEATAADRYRVSRCTRPCPNAVAEVEVLRGQHVEVSPMTHYYGFWMQSVNADYLTWRIYATIRAQAAAGMILAESSGRVQFTKLHWLPGEHSYRYPNGRRARHKRRRPRRGPGARAPV